MEQWKDIVGYEGLYQVSNKGNVKSLLRCIIRNDGKIKTFKEHILKPSDNGCGYRYVILSKNGNTKLFLVHRLVATAFIDNPNNYAEINHKDEHKDNNMVDNLEWCTRCYNNNYGNHAANISHSKTSKLYNVS